MIAPKPLNQLLATDALGPLQASIVSTLATLNPGVNVVAHPGKVDISELVNKTVVKAPGLGIGFSKIKTGQQADGHFWLAIEWVAYVVAEAKVVGNRRIEKEAVGLAIGGRVLEILADLETSLWGRTGVFPPETTPPAELKPLFTIKDQSQGVAYYTVTWTQIMADQGDSVFPQDAGRFDEDSGLILYDDPQSIEEMARFIPAREVEDDA